MLIFRVKIESTFFRKRQEVHAEGVVKWSKWSFGHLVKIDFGQTENATIIIKINFYYYSEQKRTSKMKMTKMTMTTLTTSIKY